MCILRKLVRQLFNFQCHCMFLNFLSYGEIQHNICYNIMSNIILLNESDNCNKYLSKCSIEFESESHKNVVDLSHFFFLYLTNFVM